MAEALAPPSAPSASDSDGVAVLDSDCENARCRPAAPGTASTLCERKIHCLVTVLTVAVEAARRMSDAHWHLQTLLSSIPHVLQRLPWIQSNLQVSVSR